MIFSLALLQQHVGNVFIWLFLSEFEFLFEKFLFKLLPIVLAAVAFLNQKIVFLELFSFSLLRSFQNIVVALLLIVRSRKNGYFRVFSSSKSAFLNH